MKVTEFAEAVGVHPLTVRRWIKEGKIKATKKQLKGFSFFLEINADEIKKVKSDDDTDKDN